MTDKELKKLSKTELYELLYEQELEVERLTAENKELSERHVKQEHAGSLSEAAIEVSGIIQAAQKAADVYLNNIKAIEESTLESAEKLQGDDRIRALRVIEYKNAQLKGDLERIVRDLISTFNGQLSSFTEMKSRLSELIENNDLYYLLPTGERESGKKVLCKQN